MTSRATQAAVNAFLQTNAQVQEVASTLTANADVQLSATEALVNEVDSMNLAQSSLRSSISALTSTLGVIPDELATVSTSVAAIARPGSILDRVNQTYLRDPSIPVFKWQLWYTYGNGGPGWFDGNSANGYAGINPSTWTDGDGRVSQKSNNWTYQSFVHSKGHCQQIWGRPTTCSPCFTAVTDIYPVPQDDMLSYLSMWLSTAADVVPCLLNIISCYVPENSVEVQSTAQGVVLSAEHATLTQLSSPGVDYHSPHLSMSTTPVTG